MSNEAYVSRYHIKETSKGFIVFGGGRQSTLVEMEGLFFHIRDVSGMSKGEHVDVKVGLPDYYRLLNTISKCLMANWQPSGRKAYIYRA